MCIADYLTEYYPFITESNTQTQNGIWLNKVVRLNTKKYSL